MPKNKQKNHWKILAVFMAIFTLTAAQGHIANASSVAITEVNVTSGTSGTTGGSSYRPRCGNNVIDLQIGETCDDGNVTSGDGCTSTCQIEPTLLAPDACNASASANSILWHWNMPTEESQQTGFRLTDGSNTLKETTTPLIYEINEASLQPNTLYSNRTVMGYNETFVSGTATCPATYTLVQDPISSPTITTAATSAQVSLPADIDATSLTSGSSGVWFEIKEDVSGILTPIENSGWLQNSSISFFNLKPETNYSINYKLKNGDGIETALSPSANITTKSLSGPLELTKTAILQYEGQVQTNETFTYVISYNNATGEDIANVSFKDALPDSVAYVINSFQGSNANFSANYSAITHELTVNTPAIQKGAIGSYSFKVKAINPFSSSSITNQASASYEISGITYAESSNVLNLTAVSNSLSINIYNDINSNNVQDINETGSGLNPSISLYKDDNNSGTLEPGTDTFLLTLPAVDGAVEFSNIETGNYVIAITDLPAGFFLSTNNVYSYQVVPNANNILNIALQTNNPVVNINVQYGLINFILGNFDFECVDLIFYEPNLDHLVEASCLTTQNFSASYSTNELRVGTYLVGMKGRNFLSNVVGEITITPETNGLTQNFTLPDAYKFMGGDVIEEDIINAFDLTRLISDYNLVGASSDFNRDGFINAIDLAILLKNYSLKGELFGINTYLLP